MGSEDPTLRLLTLDDVELFLDHGVASGADSGEDGGPYFGPYARSEPYDRIAIGGRTRDRWARPLDEPGWRRAWGVFDGEAIIASAQIAAGEMAADRHRVMLGMGVRREHRRHGHGRRLLAEVERWCRAEPSVAWLDLGVFADNAPAIALYRAVGFVEHGATPDRWRVDDVRIDEISMTKDVR